MPEVKYQQLIEKPPSDEDTPEVKTSPNAYLQRVVQSLCLILLYFSLSIGLTFYQQWLFKEFHFPLTVVVYHLVVKWLLSVIIRTVLYIVTGHKQLVLPFMTCVRSISLMGIASGVDVGFSNWALELVTIPLYTMTKSTTIIFILGFAILFGLEKKSWSLIGIVLTISSGLMMFTYKSTMFNWLGFNFLLIASFASGLRWTFAQLLMQDHTKALQNPVDMVFHVQPWMLLSVIPFMAYFEGTGCYEFLASLPPGELAPTILKVSVGATLAFAMELSEFLVVTYTSSLTLSVAGIFKEMCILVLAVLHGDVLSVINVLGLSLCLCGISCHVVHKVLVMRAAAAAADNGDPMGVSFRPRPRPHGQKSGEPLLLEEDTWPQSDPYTDESDVDSSTVLFEVIQRRDAKR